MKKTILTVLTVLFFSTSFTGDNSFETIASHYGYKDGFNGRKTANGEIFDMYSMTAAHKTLKFNTILKVTNLANGKEVEVRINNRGPYIKGRGLDLSYGAFREIADPKTGLIKVKAEIIKK